MIDLNIKTDINIGLILTPKLDVSLRVLMMNIIELEEKINEISETNPFVKIEDDIEQTRIPGLEFNTKEAEEAFKERFSGEDYVDPFENMFRNKENFFDEFLKEALLNFDFSNEEAKIAEVIVYNLDDKGFLDMDVEKFLRENNINKTLFESVRRKIMSLEPEGCGSRDIYEFLKFQAETLCEQASKAMKRIIEHIKERGTKNIEDAVKKLKMSKKETQAIHACLENMSLYPLQFISTSRDYEYIEPDVVVEEINGNILPMILEPKTRLTIDHEVLNLCTSSEKISETEEYTKEKYKEALNFIEALEGRRKTLSKIMNVIVKKQETFFKTGEIKALTRKDVAKETGFSVSTVTRAVANKYFMFKGVTHPISKLFSNPVSGTSKSNIQQIIKELIDNEDKRKPLGDEEIKQKLEKMGFRLTRRAVTKYRNQMNIPKSKDRRVVEYEKQNS